MLLEKREPLFVCMAPYIDLRECEASISKEGGSDGELEAAGELRPT